MTDYSLAQWFEAPPPCRVCGKPAGTLHSFRSNATLAYLCRAHAEKAIKAAHRKGQFAPDATLSDTAAHPSAGAP